MKAMLKILIFLGVICLCVFAWRKTPDTNKTKSWMVKKAVVVDVFLSGGYDKALQDIDDEIKKCRMDIEYADRQANRMQKNARVCRATGEQATVHFTNDYRPKKRERIRELEKKATTIKKAHR